MKHAIENNLWPVQDIETALYEAGGTSLKGYLMDVTYTQLCELFGEPVFDEASGDDKVQFEWCILFEESYYTIYDWKTYDPQYSMQELTTWNIGGKRDAVLSGFVAAVESALMDAR